MRNDLSGQVIHAKASYKIPQALNATLWAGYHQDSVDFQPFFYDKHKHAGYGDILEWGNLTYFNFGLKVAPMEGVHLGAGYHIFQKTDEAGGINLYNTATYTDEDTQGTGKDIGTELGLWAKKKFDNGLSAKLRFANFNPGAAITAEDENRVELRLLSKF